MQGSQNHDGRCVAMAATVLFWALSVLAIRESWADEPPPTKPPSEAPPPSSAQLHAGKAFFNRGQKLYREGNYGAAWLEFSSAYEITGSPELALNMALCKEKMNRPKDAIGHYREFLRVRPDDPEAAHIRGEIARLEQEINAANPPAPSPSTSQRRFPIIGTALAGGSLLFLIFGGVAVGVGKSRYDTLSTTCKPMCSDDAVQNARTPYNAGYAMFGLAAATAIAAAIVLPYELGLFGGDKRTASTTLVVGPGSLAIMGRF